MSLTSTLIVIVRNWKGYVKGIVLNSTFKHERIINVIIRRTPTKSTCTKNSSNTAQTDTGNRNATVFSGNGSNILSLSFLIHITISFSDANVLSLSFCTLKGILMAPSRQKRTRTADFSPYVPTSRARFVKGWLSFLT